MFLLLIICIFIIIYFYCKRYDHYQIVDVIRDTCNLECINRGHSYSYCKRPFSNSFMDNCVNYMIKNVIGPLPKGIHMEDIYASHKTSSDLV